MFNKLIIALTVVSVLGAPVSEEGVFDTLSLLTVNGNKIGMLARRDVPVTFEDTPAKKDAATPAEKKEEGIKFPDFNTVGEQVTKTFNDFTKGANPGAVEKEVKEKKEEADKKVAEAKKAVDPKKDGKDKKAAK